MANDLLLKNMYPNEVLCTVEKNILLTSDKKCGLQISMGPRCKQLIVESPSSDSGNMLANILSIAGISLQATNKTISLQYANCC
jgi:hypothetical protein